MAVASAFIGATASRIPRSAENREDVLMELEPYVVDRIDSRLADIVLVAPIDQRNAVGKTADVSFISRDRRDDFLEELHQSLHCLHQSRLDALIAFGGLPFAYLFDELFVDRFKAIV